MKRVIIVMGMLLLAFLVSCRKEATNQEATGDPNARDRIIRKQSLDECEALLAEARKTDWNDAGAAIEAYNKVLAALQDHKDDIDPSKHAEMAGEIRKAIAALVKHKALTDIVTAVGNARTEAQETRDKTRLLATLKKAIGAPGVPKELVESWTAEIKEIEEALDFDKVVKLLVAGRTDDAIDELATFTKKYPNHRKARVLKLGLEKRKAKMLAKLEAFKLYDLGRWSEALEKLKVLGKQNRGDREIRVKLRRCRFELEMIAFRQAVRKGDYKAAAAAGERARTHNPDAWDTKIAPVLEEMKARQ